MEKEEREVVSWLNLQKEAYELSSELFSFKEMRRGVIEHGKTCYIEGYKKYAELFGTFLVKNGYFSEEELHKVVAEFEASLIEKPALTIRYAEDTMALLNPRIQNLTQVQKDIVEGYRSLSNDKNMLLIQKPRQKGITTILNIITYIEAKNMKKILYLGYEPCNDTVKKLQNVTYKDIRHVTSAKMTMLLCGKHYDLIVVDEISAIDNSSELERAAICSLTENGKLIVSFTPCEKRNKNYKQLKDFADGKCYVDNDSCGRVTLTIEPSVEDYEKAEKYPFIKNEILGKFED